MRGSGRTRRDFLREMAAFLPALGWTGCATVPAGDERLSDWRPGVLDLHFIYTGCGENMFYRLPDGTSVLNDVGDFCRPGERAEIPLLPSSERPGGEWVSRYIQRIYPDRTVDYAVFSHWHSDHIGHARWDRDGRKDGEPHGDFRWRTTPDGRLLNGILCVAEDFRIRRCLDHQHACHGAYRTQDSSMELFESWSAAGRGRGLVVERFRPGALNQIALLRDPGRYAGRFSVRNICANGVVWDGRDGEIDLAAEHAEVTGDDRISQNVLSSSFVIRYGAFTYFASGDLETFSFRRKDGRAVDYESVVGELVGPTTVCKMGHHGCGNAMGEGLLRRIRSDAYVACMWSPLQAHPQTLARIAAQGPSPATGLRPLVLPQVFCGPQRQWFAENGREIPATVPVHIVIRVPPGGGDYEVFLLDAADEEMRVLAKFRRTLRVSA